MTRTIDLATLLTSADNTSNPLLTGNDLVRVLSARNIYVTGAVQKPGAFPLQTGEPLSVLEALALAQGFSTTEPPDRAHAEIIRTAADGRRTILAINLDRVLKHEDFNPPLRAGDLLYVPVSGHRKVLETMLSDLGRSRHNRVWLQCKPHFLAPASQDSAAGDGGGSGWLASWW